MIKNFKIPRGRFTLVEDFISAVKPNSSQFILNFCVTNIFGSKNYLESSTTVYNFTYSRRLWFMLLADTRWWVYHQNRIEDRSQVPSKTPPRILSQSRSKPAHATTQVLRLLLYSNWWAKYTRYRKGIHIV